MDIFIRIKNLHHSVIDPKLFNINTVDALIKIPKEFIVKPGITKSVAKRRCLEESY